jgi:hypothetical protein
VAGFVLQKLAWPAGLRLWRGVAGPLAWLLESFGWRGAGTFFALN